MDVAPKKDAGKGRFLGRIWIEDQDYNIVRFNGTYSPHPRASYYLHFDSWRQNLRPGVWLPSLIYSEESDLKYRLGQTLHYKAQTRLWGYNLKDLRRNSEFTEITVDAPQSVQDQSQKAQEDASPSKRSARGSARRKSTCRPAKDWAAGAGGERQGAADRRQQHHGHQ